MYLLQELLKKMDVPQGRLNDFGWLARNLHIRNGEHPDFDRAMLIIKNKLKIQKKG